MTIIISVHWHLKKLKGEFKDELHMGKKTVCSCVKELVKVMSKTWTMLVSDIELHHLHRKQLGMNVESEG